MKKRCGKQETRKPALAEAQSPERTAAPKKNARSTRPTPVTVRSAVTGEILRIEKPVAPKRVTKRHEHRWGPWRKAAVFSTEETRRCEKKHCAKIERRQAPITSDLESLL
jgi:hypothetical protein